MSARISIPGGARRMSAKLRRTSARARRFTKVPARAEYVFPNGRRGEDAITAWCGVLEEIANTIETRDPSTLDELVWAVEDATSVRPIKHETE